MLRPVSIVNGTITSVAKIFRGVQRHLCSLAHELLEKNSQKSLKEIKAIDVQEYGDRNTYLRLRALSEMLPFHPSRAFMIVKETLSCVLGEV